MTSILFLSTMLYLNIHINRKFQILNVSYKKLCLRKQSVDILFELFSHFNNITQLFSTAISFHQCNMNLMTWDFLSKYTSINFFSTTKPDHQTLVQVLTRPHICSGPKPGSRFALSYIVIFLLCSMN